MSLTESGTPLSQLLRTLEAFERGDVAHDVAVGLAQEGQRLVREGFASSKAPDGSRWAPLKRPRPGGPVLVKTRKLSATAPFYTVDAGGFVMDSVDRLTPYGRFHQSGVPSRNLPRRPFYPDDQLPTAWLIRLRGAADEALREHLPR